VSAGAITTEQRRIIGRAIRFGRTETEIAIARLVARTGLPRQLIDDEISHRVWAAEREEQRRASLARAEADRAFTAAMRCARGPAPKLRDGRS
jgi:hypothetical protein